MCFKGSKNQQLYMLLCVSFSLTNQVWNYFEFCLCKTYSMFEFLKGEWLKILILGKLGFKTCVLKNISSHTNTFLFLIFNALGYVFQKFSLKKKKKGAFLDFWLIHCVFQSIEILVKNFSEPLSGSIDRTCFSINRTSWIRFLKNSDLTCLNHFFKNFSNLFLSLRQGKAPQRIFCRFPPNFLQGFSLLKPVCLYYPSFCIVFLIFMHNLMVFG